MMSGGIQPVNEQQRGKYQEIKKLLGGALLFVAIFKVLDIGLPCLFLVTITQLNLTSHYAIEPADVLILGDSHVSAALDPTLFAAQGLSALSYAKGGHYAEFNEAFYIHYRRLYAPPKAVIISAPYFMFANGSDASALLSLLDFRDLTAYYWNKQTLTAPNFYQYGALFQEIPLYGRRLLGGQRHALMQYGYYDTIDANFRTKQLTAATAGAPTTASPIDYVADGYSKTAADNRANLEFFQRLIQRLDADQVTVLLVETPEYIGTQQYIAAKDVFYAEVQAEITAYPHVTLIRQADIPEIDPHDETLFSDGGYGMGNSHLSYKGSQIYTQALINLLAAKDN